MKKSIMLILLIGVITVIGACSNQDTGLNKTDASKEQEVLDTQTGDIETTVSGSFNVCVRDIIPDNCFDDVTPNVAVVTEFQSYPFTVFVGEEIGSQLEIGKVYVFTIKPIVVGYTKEHLEGMKLSSLVWELPGFEITDFRLANEDEIGLDSLCLTIE